MYSIFESYLKDRPQYVSIGKASSERILNKCGVPQGSVLGPLLYSLLVLSLRQAGLTGRYYTFADDTVFVYSGSSIRELQNIVNNDLKTYSNWLLHNKLKLNTDKTVYMVFQQKNTVNLDIHLTINKTPISKVQVTKYLGLIIDDKVNWSYHIDKIINKIVPMLGAIYRCRDYLNRINRYLIYNAYELLNIMYLIGIWGTCGLTNFKKIQIMQNKIVKVLFKKPYLTPTAELYSAETVMHPVRYFIELEKCKQVYKILHGILKCNTELSFNSEIHSHFTRGNSNIYI